MLVPIVEPAALLSSRVRASVHRHLLEQVERSTKCLMFCFVLFTPFPLFLSQSVGWLTTLQRSELVLPWIIAAAAEYFSLYLSPQNRGKTLNFEPKKIADRKRNHYSSLYSNDKLYSNVHVAFRCLSTKEKLLKYLLLLY